MRSISWPELEKKAPFLKQRIRKQKSFIKQKQILENWVFEQCLVDLLQNNYPVEDISVLSRTLTEKLKEEQDRLTEARI